jgi:uncharacterized membrane protein (UPF0127 family)
VGIPAAHWIKNLQGDWEGSIKQMVIQDLEGKIYFPHCELTETAWERMVGLLGAKELRPGKCLWIQPCNSVHTAFMKFSIDVAFLNAEGRVVAIYENMKPWRLSWIHFSAQAVLEAASGEFRRLQIEKGKVLKICLPS